MIQVEQSLVIFLQFTAFDIEVGGSSCPYDHLTITDGDGTTLMEKSCGSSLPADITSTSNNVTILFITDSHVTMTGWSVSWSAVTSGECQQHACMYIPGFPEELRNPEAGLALFLVSRKLQ